MNGLIESTYDLRKALGTTVDLVRRLDPLPRERAGTEPLRRRLLRLHGPACACCGSRKPLEAAHLVPLEIGGVTSIENLVLLCSICHNKYDQGWLSIRAMQSRADAWRTGKQLPDIAWESLTFPGRTPTVAPPPPALEGVLMAALRCQSERHFRIGVSVLDATLAQAHLPNTDRLYLLIKRAELTRRRAARGRVSEALKTLEAIDPSKLPLSYQAVFYYEFGYVLRLLGEHAQAARHMRRSAEAAAKAEGGSRQSPGYVAATDNEVLCELADKAKIGEADARGLEKKLCDLEEICRAKGGYWGGRWLMNCAAHKVQIRLKAQDLTGSWGALEKARALYFEWDLNSGWDSGARQTLSLLEGLVRVLCPREKTDVTVGTGLLARSLIGRLGPRQRPEGARDVAFALARGLRAAYPKVHEEHALRLERVAERTVDGTSVLWPWKKVRS